MSLTDSIDAAMIAAVEKTRTVFTTPFYYWCFSNLWSRRTPKCTPGVASWGGML